jgi:transposase
MRTMGLSRRFVRKTLREPTAEAAYAPRRTQPMPKLGAFAGRLDELLAENAARPKKDRLRLTRIHDLLRREGFDGSYDAVRRYAYKQGRVSKPTPPSEAFVPLVFAPGDAFQFDWSHEIVVLGGVTTTVKVAHMRLCCSRKFYLRAYMRETQEMVFDAHARAFAFFGGITTRGIYDNMTTAVQTVFMGKERAFNRRFLLMTDHYGFTPVACTPAAGWEKGQVENQVSTARERFFKPRLHFQSLDELNGWLEAECTRWCATHPHPEWRELSIEAAFALERPALAPLRPTFDGFHEREATASATCLVNFDRNKYSVMSEAARRVVQVRAYADRIVIRCGGKVVADHPRQFGRNKTKYDFWHYVPILTRKPGALRNGAPFLDWDLPPGLAELRCRMGKSDEADRRFVRVLAMALSDGLESVEAAIAEALAANAASDEVILNILARRREPPAPEPIATPEALRLAHPPLADCARYDHLRAEAPRAAA